MTGKRAARKPRSPQRFVWATALVLLGVQLGVTALLAVDQYTGREAVVISGGSMEPEFSRGDLVWIDADATPAPDDIITFNAPSGDGTVITHRIVSEGGDAFRTKGDANKFEDVSSVPEGDVLGVVTSHQPGLGYVIIVVASGWGKLATYGPILVLVLVGEVNGLRGTLCARRRQAVQQVAV